MTARTPLVILLWIGLWTNSASGQLKTTETEDVDIIYTSPLHKYLLPQLVSTFTNSYNFHRNLFGYTPTENISILMQDFGDFGHGGADALPTNNVNIGIGPFNYVYETMPASERMNGLLQCVLAISMNGAFRYLCINFQIKNKVFFPKNIVFSRKTENADSEPPAVPRMH